MENEHLRVLCIVDDYLVYQLPSAIDEPVTGYVECRSKPGWKADYVADGWRDVLRSEDIPFWDVIHNGLWVASFGTLDLAVGKAIWSLAEDPKRWIYSVIRDGDSVATVVAVRNGVLVVSTTGDVEKWTSLTWVEDSYGDRIALVGLVDGVIRQVDYVMC